jgi:hypothetical protein
MLTSQEKGASAVITTLPLKKYGFALSKSEFTDHLLMRYRMPLSDLPMTCKCGKPFSLDHSQVCHLGGFVNARHDEVRDLLAEEMRHVLTDVQTEPPLTPLSGETLNPSSAILNDDARLDIRARSFWTSQRNAFFDVRIFYPHAQSYSSKSLSSLYDQFEHLKKSNYNDRVVNVEHGSFTPLVFSALGGMGKEAKETIRKLASLLAEKSKEDYSHVVGLLRARIAFSLARSAGVLLRGTRQRRAWFSGVGETAEVACFIAGI